MSKFNKVTYCKNCGQSNSWALEAKKGLLQKPTFCSSCGTNLLTGKKPAKRQPDVIEVEEDEDVHISTDISPLELDLNACYFPTRDSQSLGNLMKPVPEQKNEDA
jgi:hypothetical protein